MIGSGVTRLVALVPSIVSIVLFLLLARHFLLRRASVPPGNLLPRLFALLDRLMQWANRFAGGVVLLRERGSLPGDDPVYWRETQRRALGKPHYLLRVLCVLEIPTVFLCVGTAMIDPENTTGLSLLAAALTILIIFLLGTTVTAVEQSGLGTPRAKPSKCSSPPLRSAVPDHSGKSERALRRLEWVLAVPLLTVICFPRLVIFAPGTGIMGANAFGRECQRATDSNVPPMKVGFPI